MWAQDQNGSSFRPEVYQAVRKAKKVVIDQNILWPENRCPGIEGLSLPRKQDPYLRIHCGWGRDIAEIIEEAIQYTFDHSLPEGEIHWLGLKA
jgi:hypothetical protein